jgi:hypothetical protein
MMSFILAALPLHEGQKVSVELFLVPDTFVAP